MIARRTALSLVVLWMLGFSSCASDPVQRASGPESREYFPLRSGGHWSYEIRTGLFSRRTRMDVTARGEHAIRGSDQRLFLMEEQLSGRIYGLEPAGLVGYRVSDGYLTRIAAVTLEPDGQVNVFGGEGMSFLPVDPAPGQTWSARTEVFRGSGGAGQSWTAEVEAAGSVCVRAGSFDDVIVVRSQQWDPDWDTDRPLHSYEDYYARGVGLLRSVTKNEREGGTQMVEQTLLAFDFPQTDAQNQ